MSLLNAGQIELGNVFMGTNYRGEAVSRRVVGGAYGSVVKYFLVDEKGALKSHKRDTIEELIEGFEVNVIVAPQTKEDITATIELNDGEGIDLEVGDVFIVIVNGLPKYRQLVGGTAYKTNIFFTIDPETGKRTSRTRETIEEVMEGYITEEGTDRIIAVLTK